MIYAIAMREAGAVKIGVAVDPNARLFDLQCASPYALEIVASCEGGFRQERLLHKIFAKAKIRREWFRATVLEEFVEIANDCDPKAAIDRAWSAELARIKDRQLSEYAARRLLAAGLSVVCASRGPLKVAKALGCDEKTIRRARDEESTLGLACAWNLLDVDSHALDALAAAKGVMLIPLMADAPDVVVAAGAAIHSIGKARDPHGAGAHHETDAELLGMEAEADGMLAAALELRSRIVLAKLRRAA